jgi:hypothetical protein
MVIISYRTISVYSAICMDFFYMKVVIHNLKMCPISVVLRHTSMFNIKYPMFMVYLYADFYSFC